jgi:hypothetical protein
MAIEIGIEVGGRGEVLGELGGEARKLRLDALALGCRRPAGPAG